jgi:hypothetical protein
VRGDNVVHEIDDVGARQRFTASQKESLRPKRDRLINRVSDNRRRQAMPKGGTRRHQAVRAGQVAEVV